MACPSFLGKASRTALQLNTGMNQPRAIHKTTPSPYGRAPHTSGLAQGSWQGRWGWQSPITPYEPPDWRKGPRDSWKQHTACTRSISGADLIQLLHLPPIYSCFFPQTPCTKDISIFLLPWSFKENLSPTFCYVFLWWMREGINKIYAFCI